MASNTTEKPGEAPMSYKIAKMKEKVKLVQGELRANEDSSQFTITQNREAIAQLRQSNTDLRRKLVRFHATENRILTGNMAVLMLREESAAKMKQLNGMVHATQLRRQHLEDLRLRYLAAKPQRIMALEHGRRTTALTMKKRGLDTSLALARTKVLDAENISRAYHEIRQELKQEGFRFQNQLDCLDSSILETREELAHLRESNREAQQSTEVAEDEMRRHEEALFREREAREAELRRYRSQIVENREQSERAVSGALQAHRRFQVRAAFRHLCAVTCLPNRAQETVERFVAQLELRGRLERTRGENDGVLRGLRDTKEGLDQELVELRLNVAEKRRREKAELAEPQNRLRTRQRRNVSDECNLDHLVGTLSNVRPIVESLGNRLQHIKLVGKKKKKKTKKSKEEEESESTEDDMKVTPDAATPSEMDVEEEDEKKEDKDKDKDTATEDEDDDDDDEEDEEEEDEEDEEEQLLEALPPVPVKGTGESAAMNYWTELNNTLQHMVHMLTTCASKLLQLNDDFLADEERKKRRKARAKAKAAAAKWKPPKRQKGTCQGHIKRIKEKKEKKKW